MHRGRLALGACALFLLLGCRSHGLVGRECDGGACRNRLDAAPAPVEPPDPCAAGGCELDAATPIEPADTCPPGGCEVDACVGDACAAAPSCDGGICQMGLCDGGACEPDVGCNAMFPICARCKVDADCITDRDEPYCDGARGRCVECRADPDCAGDEPFCLSGECEECRSDADCDGAERCLNGDCEDD